MSLNQERIRDDGYRERVNAESMSHLGIRTAEITLSGIIPGHLTTTAGVLTQTWFHQLLAHGLGGSDTTAVGTTLSAASSATSFTLTSTTGWSAGKIGRVGNKAEARGNGQAFVVNSVGPPTTSLVALPATPNAADIVYAMQQAYHDETTMASLNTKRFMVGWATQSTAGAQFQLNGCQMAGATLTFPFDNTLPRYQLRYVGGYWSRDPQTIPSTALTLEDDYAAPCVGGSLHISDVGTSTRTPVTASELEINIDLGLAPIVGPHGVGTYQLISGWQRTGAKPSVRVRMPYTTAYETWFDTANQTIASKNLLFLSNGIDGRCIGAFCPSLIPVGNRPSVPVESNEQAYVDVFFSARDGATTTSELTRSALRLAFG